MFSALIQKELERQRLSVTSLSSLIGTSCQNLSQKLKRDNFSEKEMRDIASALGVPLSLSLGDSDNVESLKGEIAAVLGRY